MRFKGSNINNVENYQDTLAGLSYSDTGQDLGQFYISHLHSVPSLPALQDPGNIDNEHLRTSEILRTFYIYHIKYLAIRVFTRAQFVSIN